MGNQHSGLSLDESISQFNYNNLALSGYQIMKSLGEGSYGKVRVAKQRSSGKYYAIKYIDKRHGMYFLFSNSQMLFHYINSNSSIIAPSVGRTIVEERRILTKLYHPFICNMNYSFQDENFYCLVLDYADCGDLRHQIEKRNFSEDIVRHWIAELACAIDYLHEHHVVHRDIKPENILIKSNGHVCLADFNIARELTCKRPIIVGVSGTLNYLAPEIHRGRNYTEKVDWWALGVVFYESIYKKVPFKIRQKTEILPLLDQGLVFPETNPSVSDACKSAMMCLLQQDPDDRIQDTIELFGLEFFKGYDRATLETAPYIMQNSSYSLMNHDSIHVPQTYEIAYRPKAKWGQKEIIKFQHFNDVLEDMKGEYPKWYAKQVQIKLEREEKQKGVVEKHEKLYNIKPKVEIHAQKKVPLPVVPMAVSEKKKILAQVSISNKLQANGRSSNAVSRHVNLQSNTNLACAGSNSRAIVTTSIETSRKQNSNYANVKPGIKRAANICDSKTVARLNCRSSSLKEKVRDGLKIFNYESTLGRLKHTVAHSPTSCVQAQDHGHVGTPISKSVKNEKSTCNQHKATSVSNIAATGGKTNANKNSPFNAVSRAIATPFAAIRQNAQHRHNPQKLNKNKEKYGLSQDKIITSTCQYCENNKGNQDKESSETCVENDGLTPVKEIDYKIPLDVSPVCDQPVRCYRGSQNVPKCKHDSFAIPLSTSTLKNKIDIERSFETFDIHRPRFCNCQSTLCWLNLNNPSFETRVLELRHRWELLHSYTTPSSLSTTLNTSNTGGSFKSVPEEKYISGIDGLIMEELDGLDENEKGFYDHNNMDELKNPQESSIFNIKTGNPDQQMAQPKEKVKFEDSKKTLDKNKSECSKNFNLSTTKSKSMGNVSKHQLDKSDAGLVIGSGIDKSATNKCSISANSSETCSKKNKTDFISLTKHSEHNLAKLTRDETSNKCDNEVAENSICQGKSKKPEISCNGVAISATSSDDVTFKKCNNKNGNGLFYTNNNNHLHNEKQFEHKKNSSCGSIVSGSSISGSSNTRYYHNKSSSESNYGWSATEVKTVAQPPTNQYFGFCGKVTEKTPCILPITGNEAYMYVPTLENP